MRGVKRQERDKLDPLSAVGQYTVHTVHFIIRLKTTSNEQKNEFHHISYYTIQTHQQIYQQEVDLHGAS